MLVHCRDWTVTKFRAFFYSRSELKLGVLVNEVAAIDVDGQLLRTTQSNAAAGIKAAQLAGGCACCSVSGDLQAALHELASSSSYQQLDYLVRRTQQPVAQHSVSIQSGPERTVYRVLWHVVLHVAKVTGSWQGLWKLACSSRIRLRPGD
jgi:hypothetical protein